MFKAICILCDFQISGDSLDELDEKYKPHFENSGHATYFFHDKYGRRTERTIS